MTHCAIIPATLLTIGAFASAQPVAFIADSVPCDVSNAFPFLVQADRDAAPEWAILTGSEMVISETRPGTDDRTIRLPDATTLFDFRDTDHDGIPELAIVRGRSLEYWPDATTAATTQPRVHIQDDRFAALAYGAPRPTQLFFRRRGGTFLSAAIYDEPRIWDLAGLPVPSAVDEEPPEPALIFAQSWDAVNRSAGPDAGREYTILQRFEIAASTTIPDRQPAGRVALEATASPPELWPSFPLTQSGPPVDRIGFARLPGALNDTLVVRRPADMSRASTPRRLPGIIILPAGRAPDLNGDGYADIVVWRLARPAPALDALTTAARTGAIEIVVTVHLFDAAADRYAGRPTLWFRAMAPIFDTLAAGIAGPFAQALFDDIDRDGRDEMLTSGSGNEVLGWKFSGSQQTEPDYRLTLNEPVSEWTTFSLESAPSWLMIAKTPSAFHLITLPQH